MAKISNSKVKNDNYAILAGWMVTELKLKGNELIIYSIIYGFSQSENQVFNGSLQYLADWTNSTKQGVAKCLKSLVQKGYIIKTDKVINGVKFCEYYATKFNGVYNKVARGIQQSCIGGMQQSLTNNIEIDNIEKNKNIEKLPKESAMERDFEECWKIYPKKQGKQKAFLAYKKSAKASKNPDFKEIVLKGIQNYITYINANKTQEQFIKQGSTYFCNECWNDEYNDTAKGNDSYGRINKGIILD